MICAIPEGLLDANYAFLVAARFIVNRADTGRNDQ
jgi:hypothetical protein